MRVLASLLIAGITLVAAFNAQAEKKFVPLCSKALPAMKVKALKSLPWVMRCPRFIMNPQSGLANSVLPKTTVCLSSTDVGSLKKDLKQIDFPLDGTAQEGDPFITINEPVQGDLNTSPFVIKHYPTIINFSMSDLDSAAGFKMRLNSLDKDKYLPSTSRHHGSDEEPSIDGNFWYAARGNYFFRVETDNKNAQPTYFVESGFMEPYEGYPVDTSDLKSYGIKTRRCPRTVIDLRSSHKITLSSSYICSNNTADEIQEAGFTLAPYSLANGQFITTGIDEDGAGDGGLLPFRVIDPVVFTYEITDPTEDTSTGYAGGGDVKIELVDLASGAVDELADTTGSLSNRSFYISKQGEFYLRIKTSPKNPTVNGDIYWYVSVQGT
jgi:hypothetical protein